MNQLNFRKHKRIWHFNLMDCKMGTFIIFPHILITHGVFDWEGSHIYNQGKQAGIQNWIF